MKFKCWVSSSQYMYLARNSVVVRLLGSVARISLTGGSCDVCHRSDPYNCFWYRVTFDSFRSTFITYDLKIVSFIRNLRYRECQINRYSVNTNDVIVQVR